MGLFAKNRRYYLIPLENREESKKFFQGKKKNKPGEIFDKRKNLIGKMKIKGDDIIVTETNRVICLRLKKLPKSSSYSIEDHFGNYLGRVKTSKNPNEKILVENNKNEKILFTRGFVEWNFTIQNQKKQKIAVGTTTNMMLSKTTHDIRHTKPSFLLSLRPHHPDSRFLFAIFVVLLQKMPKIDISRYQLKLGPAVPL